MLVQSRLQKQLMKSAFIKLKTLCLVHPFCVLCLISVVLHCIRTSFANGAGAACMVH